MKLFFLYFLHLIFQPVNLLFGKLLFYTFYSIGSMLNALIHHIESFYQNNKSFKDKIVLNHILLKRKVSFCSKSQRLLKAQLKNKGFKKQFTFNYII